MIGAGGRRNSRLYHVLEVGKKATPAEITQAHRRLARKYHPDRAGVEKEACETKFKELQQAYEILSNERSRKMYDTLGDEGLKLMQNGAMPDIGMALFDKSVVCALLCVLMVVVSLIIVQFALIADRVQAGTEAWAVVLIPVWILDALLGCICLATLPSAVSKLKKRLRGEREENPWPMLLFMFSCGMFLAWTVMLCRGLEGHLPSGGWAVVFWPAFVLQALMLVHSGLMLRRSAYEQKVREEERVAEECGVPYRPETYAVHVFECVAKAPWMLAFFILLVLKLDGKLGSSWWVIGSPLLARLAVGWVLSVSSYQRKTKAADDDAPPVCCAMFFSLLFYGTGACAISLCLAKAEGYNTSLALAFLPVFIPLGCLCCMLCCGAMVAMAADPDASPEDDIEKALSSERHRHQHSEEEEPVRSPIGDTRRPETARDSPEGTPLLQETQGQGGATGIDDCD